MALFYLFIFVCLRICNGQLPLISSDHKAECQIDCSSDLQRLVCGTDGRTYDSKCEINKAKCEGHPVEFKHRGKCPEAIRCTAHRSVAQAQARKHVEGIFIPECKEDGSYMEVQCHNNTGYCWCVNILGRPIPGTSLHGQKPNCTQPSKRTNRRRSSHNRRKGCNDNDRSVFNENLIKLFKSEYRRIFQTAEFYSPANEVHTVILWKFGELDKNHDSVLKKGEVRDFRRMAKKIVKPRPCAKTFTKYCDSDQDKKISQLEWSLCLRVNINKERRSGEENENMDSSTDDIIIDTDEVWGRQKSLLNSGEKVKEEVAEDDMQDCLTARETALENHRQDPNGKVYIPSCTQGLYDREQCHKYTGYCWCVDIVTGKPIKGTATKGITPDCSRARRKARMFKGCSQQKRQEFLDELINSIEREINQVNASVTSSSMTKRTEEVIKWKFRHLDSNGNQYLDKREWLNFRREWKSFLKTNRRRRKLRKLRKCWRNFLRFCDANHNNKITMEEWMICTGIIGDNRSRMPIKRRGPNPFDKILKSD